jgi:1-acyl-sn-glycerol-3-phosphate acyltransferase
VRQRGSLFYELCGILARCLIRLYSRFEIYGLDNIPASGPVILAANHISNADPVLLAATMPRPAVFMAKRELLRWPGMIWVVRAYGSFTVRRGAADREAIRRALKALGEGRVLGLFPEGTRSKSGALGEPFAGVGLLALRTGAPVVPIGIRGTELVSPRKPLWKRPRVVVTIGKPIPSPRVTGAVRGAARQHTERVMRAIAALLPANQRGRFLTATDAFT